MASHKHRSSRPRFGRIAALGAALTVVVIALAGAAGVLRSSPDATEDDTVPASSATQVAEPVETPAPTQVVEPVQTPAPTSAVEPVESSEPAALPAGSGAGKRVVFSQSEQRVWLVDSDGDVERSYLVSGSVTDNLDPGRYEVYSTSRWAVGIDDSGVMEYFVRFTQGPSGAAIGFHTIPTKNGEPLQTKKQLGTPQSHGCIRQRTGDAIALWDFAPLGTKVVVV